MGHVVRRPLFRSIEFVGLSVASKKQPSFDIRLVAQFDDHIYTVRRNNVVEVVGYRDPVTGLFQTNLMIDDPDDAQLPSVRFRNAATEWAEQQVQQKLQELKKIEQDNPAQYEEQYKSYAVIERALLEQLSDAVVIQKSLLKDLSYLLSKPLPHINETLIYQDDPELGDESPAVTHRVPYLNPQYQTVTEEETQLVDQFLDVFVDVANKDVLSWFFGAVLSNVPLQDPDLSKVLIVTSARGGSGKSTLINTLAEQVVTKPYAAILGGFDRYFDSRSPFGTGDLPIRRLTVFSEAYFNNDTQKGVSHDFSGLDDSAIKTWITEGRISREAKYKDRMDDYLTGLSIILTNYPPDIPPHKRDLTRRFLPLVIRPTDMIQDKAPALGFKDRPSMESYVAKHAQAFANYFVNSFQENPTRYRSVLYSTSDVEEEVDDGELELAQARVQRHKGHSKDDPIDWLVAINTELRLTDNRWISVVQSARREDHPDVRWESSEKKLYITSNRSFYAEYGVPSLRERLKEEFEMVHRFRKRWFEIPYGGDDK